jgi:hypothetical protein
VKALLLLLALCVPALAAEPPPPPDKSFPVTIQPKDFETLVNYLAAEPYARVAPILSMLAQAAEASRPKPSEPPPAPK